MKTTNRKRTLGIIFLTLWIIPLGIQSYRNISPVISKDKESFDASIIRAYNPTTFDLIIKRCSGFSLLLIPIGIVLLILSDKEHNKRKVKNY